MIEITSLGHMMAMVNDRTKVTVIDFYADWCGPCQTIKPEYERVASFYDAALVNFCKCNVDRCKDCAGHFVVRTIPTFVVCVGGETMTTVQGGDLGVLQRNIDLALGQAEKAVHQQQQQSQVGRNLKQGAGALKDAFAEQMLKIKKSRLEGDTIAEKDACDAAYKLLWEQCAPEHPAATRHPFGVILLPYLASEAFAVSAVSGLFHAIGLRAQPSCYDGELIVNQCLRYVIQLMCMCTWDDMELVRLLHSAVLALLQVPETQPMVVRSIYFHDECINTGMGLEQNTLLGALLGVGPYAKGIGMPVGQRNNAEWEVLLRLFKPADKANHEQLASQMQQTVEVLALMNVQLVKALLAGRGTRDVTLRYLGRALLLNEDYQKTMHHNSPLSSRYFMVQLQSVLIEVALPVFTRNGGFDPSAIPASYLLDTYEETRHCVVVTFGANVERVQHFDEEHALPHFARDSASFKPAVHLFYLAARAITLCATVLIDEHERAERDSTHPQAPPNQRDAFRAEARLCEGLLGSVRLGESRMQYLNGLARWLLRVMGVNAAGELPATPPVEWDYLPQQLVDCVIRATQMAPIDSLYVDSMISVLLVLMGNLRYFPKPHTHALFPGFLLHCMRDKDAQRALENHPWFSNRIVRACIDGYIAVEKCPYERVRVRYELSHCIKSFLKYDSLCNSVREEFKTEGTVLERFSHMAVAEVNESVDQLIENLTKMNTLIKDGADLSENAIAAGSSNSTNNHNENQQRRLSAQGNNRRNGGGNSNSNNNHSEGEEEEEENEGGQQTYHQLGVGLRSHIMLFKASMGMFIELSNQFPKGVSQNLVAQQISQMLARSLVAFAGPNSSKLKIENASKYDFNPREILSTLVDCLTRFRRTGSFLRCLCHGGTPLEEVRGAMTTVISRHLVSEELTWKLSEMMSALDSIKQDVDDEETLWDEAPDFALDALLSTPLAHPVALPSEVKDLDDLVYVNKDTIHHLLLSESKHPFTKAYLDEKMVESFNVRPEVVQHREKLQASITIWLAEAKARRLSAKK